jgi:hypothetical protein
MPPALPDTWRNGLTLVFNAQSRQADHLALFNIDSIALAAV